MLAFSYLRFSRPEQMSGDSWRRQTAATARYCAQHGLTLSSKLEDLGVSAFRGKNSTQGALGAFLERIREGTVPRGSRLIVESLDRVTRQSPMKAIALFTEIIEAGVSIVTLADGQLYDQTSTSEIGNMMMMVMVACRAHEESLTKSKRLAEAWSNKRTKGGVLTALCPAWMDHDGAKFVLNKHAKTVKKIFEWGAAGMGQTAINRKLEEDGYEPFGRSKKWHKSYIYKILTNEAVTGRHQHMSGKYPNRKPMGEKIEAYFPRVVSDALYFKNQENLQVRKSTVSKSDPAKNTNIFSGLIVDAEHNVPIWFVPKGKNPIDKKLYSSYMHQERVGMPYFLFERAIIQFQTEIDWNGIMNKKKVKEKGNNNSERIFKLSQKKKTLEKAIEENPELSDSLINALKKCTHEINELRSEEYKIESTVPSVRFDLGSNEGRAIAANEMKKNIEVINCWTHLYKQSWIIEVKYRIGYSQYIMIRKEGRNEFGTYIIDKTNVKSALQGEPLIIRQIKDGKDLAESVKNSKV